MRSKLIDIARSRKAVFLYGLAATPSCYFILYFLLRVTGVYFALFNQGRWEIEGGTNIYLIDIVFVPMVILENEMQFTMDWQKVPSGG